MMVTRIAIYPRFIVLLTAAACIDAPESRVGSEDSMVSGAGGQAVSERSIRLVNYWVHDGAGATVDVFVRGGFGREQPLFENAAFGEVRAGTVSEDASLLIYHAGQEGVGEGLGSPSFIVSEDLGRDLETGVPLTVVITYATPLRADRLAGAVDVLFDAGDFVVGGMPVRTVEGVLLVALYSPVGRVLGDANPGFKLGVPGEACLRPAGSRSTNAITVSAGGTSAMTYDLAPGRSMVAAYAIDDSRCTGAVMIGPVEVNAIKGTRTFVFAFGTGPGDWTLSSLTTSPSP